MTGKSHAIIGAAVGYFFWGTTAIPYSVAGALLTDIDEPNSTISRLIFPKGSYSKSGRVFLGVAFALAGIYLKFNYLVLLGLGILVLSFIPHRGILHSPAFLIFLTMLALHHFGRIGILIYLLAGYASHILADAFTEQGIPFFYPFSSRKYGLGLIKTGGLGENFIIVMLILAIYCYA